MQDDKMEDAKLFIVQYITAAEIDIHIPASWHAEFERCCATFGDAIIHFQPGSGYRDVSPIVMAVQRLRRKPEAFQRVIPALVRHAGAANIAIALHVAEARGYQYMVPMIQELRQLYYAEYALPDQASLPAALAYHSARAAGLPTHGFHPQSRAARYFNGSNDS